MSTQFPYTAEVRLLRWGESSSAGRTITLELPPEDGEAHPFRGLPTGHTHGQRFRMQFSVITDDETPPAEQLATTQERTTAPAAVGGPRSNSAKMKERYQNATAMEQATVRSRMLPRDRRFRIWVTQVAGWDECSEADAIYYIKSTCCNGESRGLIAEVSAYYDAFIAMETTFKIDINQMAEPR